MHALLLLVALLSYSTTAYRPLRPMGQKRNGPLLSSLNGKTPLQSQESTFDRPSIFIGNIPLAVTKDQLEEEMRNRLGDRFQSCYLVHDKLSGKSRGFAYVNVNDDDSIDEALSQLNGAEILGRALKVDLKITKKLQSRTAGVERERVTASKETSKKNAFPQQKAKPDYSEVNARSIFVGNLDNSWSREDFQRIITDNLGIQFGDIQCRLTFLPSGTISDELS